VVAALLAAPSASAQEVGPRVIEGSDAAPGDHPHQILLRLKGRFICGGSILDRTHIVTAAHCVVGEDSSFYPRVVGPGDLSFMHDGVDRPGGANETTDLTEGPAVETVSVDPRYLRGINPYENDSAVLTLQSPGLDLSGRPNTKAIQLASQPEVDAAFASGAKATVSGWGVTDPGEQGRDSDILQAADVSLVSDSTCRNAYPNRIVDAVMLCAGAFSPAPDPPTQDTCQGDSGGPLSVRVEGVLKLAGLTSFGDGCGRLPGVYTELNETPTRAFVTNTSQVPPPSTAEGPTVSGTPRVGAEVTCNPPAVTGANATRYFWFAITGTDANELDFSTQTITVPASAQGTRLICDARLENAGGFFYAEADFASAFGPIGAAPAAGGGTGGGSGTGGGTNTPPAFSLLSDLGFGGFPGRRTSLRRVLSRGLAGRISCNVDCTFRASLVLPRASARKARFRGRTVVVSRVSSNDSAGGSGRRIRFKFKRSVAQKMRRLTRGTAIEVRVTASDSRGTRRTEKKTLRLKR